MTCECGIQLFLKDLQQHRSCECPERTIQCRFCHTLTHAGPISTLSEDRIQKGAPITEHESHCGSRTIVCKVCSKSVRIRDVPMHMSLHDFEKKSQPLPLVLCANLNCSRSVDPNGGSAKKAGLCSFCFGPLYVREHDPEGKLLLQRLVHRYYMQMFLGCGQPHCTNQVCRLNSQMQSPKI